MQKIINIKFISLEFDFGYSKDDESTFLNKGSIDAEVFVEIEDEGINTTITHKLGLKDVSFTDLVTTEEKENIISNINTVGGLIQALRMLVSLKVANDLNMEIADINYISPIPQIEILEEQVNDLNIAMANIMGV